MLSSNTVIGLPSGLFQGAFPPHYIRIPCHSHPILRSPDFTVLTTFGYHTNHETPPYVISSNGNLLHISDVHVCVFPRQFPFGYL